MSNQDQARERERKKLKAQVQKRYEKLKKLVIECCGQFDIWKEPIAWQGAQLQYDIDEMMLTISIEGRTIAEEGSKGQNKNVAHPLTQHLKDAHRSLTSVLAELQLTSASKFKKQENNTERTDNDPTSEYFNTINGV